MPITAEKNQRKTLSEHIADYITEDRGFMEGTRKGMADCKAGRKQLWSDVKKELGIQ